MKVKKEYLLIILFLISFLIYLPALKSPFFMDDYKIVKGTLYFDSFLWGTSAGGYHFTNIILNAIASILAFYFINFFLKDKIFSFWIALLFSLHPVHTETVIWIKNRPDLISFIFIMFSFLSFFKKRYLTYPFFIISLLARGSAVIFPLVLTGYLYIYRDKKEIKKTFPFWLLAFISLIFRAIWTPQVLDKGGLPNFGMHVLAIIKTYAFYFRLLLFPVDLSIKWNLSLIGGFFQAENFFSIIVMLSFIALIYFMRKKKEQFFFLMLLFVSILPYSNIIFLGGRPWAEQRLYLPSLVYAILMGMLLLKRGRWKYVFFLLVFLYGIKTVARNNQWKNPQVILDEAKKIFSRDSRIEINMGNSYCRREKFSKAKPHFLRALVLDPDNSQNILQELGVICMKEGNFTAAIEYLQKFLEVEKDSMEAYYNLGLAYMKANRYKDAIRPLEKAKELEPDNLQIYNNLAITYRKNNEFPKAVEVLKEVLSIKPDYLNARYNLVMVYKKSGKYDEAIKELKYILKKHPDNPDFINLYKELKDEQ